jgi:hypothetical protein
MQAGEHKEAAESVRSLFVFPISRVAKTAG